MDNLKADLKDFKALTVGAACFDLPTGKKFCANSVTYQQAQQFANDKNITLTNWQPGKSCSQVKC